MKKSVLILIALLSVVTLSCCGSGGYDEKWASYENLGNCIGDNIWDIALHEGKLFFGTGDGNTNTGPTKIWAYDVNKGEFSESGTLAEEVINSFLIIDDKLVAPGIDPTDKGDNVNYNYYENGEWKKYSDIGPTDHLFDVVKFNDTYFYGVDYKIGASPVLSQKEHNGKIAYVPFYKDGEKLSMSSKYVRVFDLVEFKDNLYAWLTTQSATSVLSRDIYKYNLEKNCFEYYSSAFDGVKIRNYINFKMIGTKASGENIMYIATPEGYYTVNMLSFKKLNFQKNIVCDFWQERDNIYALCSRNVDGKIRTSVWSTKADCPEDFKELFYFESDYGCISFAKSGNSFYFGTSDNMNNGEKGVVLKVTR